MATMRQTAQDMIGVARDGIGWIALWKDGKGWMARDLYPDIDRRGNVVFEDYETEALQRIREIDPKAILVNGYHHNLGDPETMTRDTLSDALRWHYGIQHYTVSDALTYGARV